MGERLEEETYTRVSLRIINIFKAIFMHNPVSLLAMGSSASVEDEGFPHTNLLVGVSDALVSSCCLPKSCTGGPVRPGPRWILPVLVAEEIPLVLWCRTDLTSLYKI